MKIFGPGSSLAPPLAASLLAHAVALGGLAVAVRDGGSEVPREALVPIRRAEEPARAPGRVLVEAPPEAAGHGVEGAAIPLDSPDPRYREYLRAVRQRIWDRWRAPELPPARIRGSLLVEFSIAHSGRLTAAELRESSGSRQLDRAALDAVRLAAPYAPLPRSMDRDALRIRTRFVYE